LQEIEKISNILIIIAGNGEPGIGDSKKKSYSSEQGTLRQASVLRREQGTENQFILC
jgi:hypothetical protein